MKWLKKLLSSKNQKPKKKYKTADDYDMAYAKKVVDETFLPVLKRNLEILNTHLASKNLRAGIEINWFFDKIDED